MWSLDKKINSTAPTWTDWSLWTSCQGILNQPLGSRQRNHTCNTNGNPQMSCSASSFQNESCLIGKFSIKRFSWGITLEQLGNRTKNNAKNIIFSSVVSSAPSRGPGFESQAHYLRFFQFVLLKLYRENSENKQKEAGIGSFFNKSNITLRSLPKTKATANWMSIEIVHHNNKRKRPFTDSAYLPWLLH